MPSNPQLDLAYRFVSETDRHVFLTGKAGTGKTTFLHRVRREIDKRLIVVAPTGVAAINAKGVTIHSQFQLPFGVLTPDRLRRELRTHRLSRKKAEVLRHLDLLVIDEISMVRVDVLDAISSVLSKYRRDDRPFGGVQLLMVGDLHQLPPVVRDDEAAQLREHYPTPYFFGSQRLREAGVRTVQLTHIYRQADPDFIRLLNRVRTNSLGAEELAALNSRYRDADFIRRHADDYITLTSHNRQARQLNQRKLGELTAPLHTFSAEIHDTFPESMYPNDVELHFRVGAQVMFNRNDTTDQLYYNGKIGRILAIEGEEIRVACPGEEPIPVTPIEWENRRYEVNTTTQEVNGEVIGRYVQHPLQLAWAITIHKSQGLTFDRVIIDAAHAFAHGQVYVALSRCKTFDGILLRSRIGDDSVHTDRVVSSYSERAEADPPTDADLFADRRTYQLNCLRELFSFGVLTDMLDRLRRLTLEREASIQGAIHREVQPLREAVIVEIVETAHRFRAALGKYATHPALPADHPELLSRLTGAASYFLPRLDRATEQAGRLTYQSDNKKVRKSLDALLDRLNLTLRTKILGFKVLGAGFTPAAYLKSRAQAQVPAPTETSRGRTAGNSYSPAPTPATVTIGDQAVYERLVQWRKKRSGADDVPAYCVLHNTVLIGISEHLPATKRELLALRGFGKKSWERYGEEILSLVAASSGPRSGSAPAPPPDKRPSRVISYEAYLAGSSVADIAAERSLTERTIYTHLSHYVRSGDLDVATLLSAKAREAILPFLHADEELPDALIYRQLGGEVAYHEIRLARAHLQQTNTGRVVA